MEQVLKDYIAKKFGSEKTDEILRRNYLQFLYLDKPHNVELLLNKANVMMLENELLNICKLFDHEQIKYITFKGVVLANRLYENKYKRFFSDIDILVFPKDFEQALNILYNNGFSLRYPNTLQGLHHAALRKGKVVVELHRNILNPFTKIDETYMYEHVEELQISAQKITTFDETATLLHLFYHLYMDCCLSASNMYSIYAKKQLSTPIRFISRSYDLSLFAKKYYNSIRWNEILNDLEKQELRIIFKKMVYDILDIFPEIFPDFFVEGIYKLNYIIEEKDVIYKHIMDYDLSPLTMDEILSDFIDKQWHGNNISISAHNEHFVLDNVIINNTDLEKNYQMTCTVTVKKDYNDVKLVFNVSNDDFCFSSIDDYDTQTTDGVHLIICGTERYSYNSIFLFPKNINNKVVVIPVDVLNGKNRIIDESLISTIYNTNGHQYTITATLNQKFLQENNLEKFFYLGLVISNCSNKTKTRKSTLVLSNPHSEWYNPLYFAKITII